MVGFPTKKTTVPQEGRLTFVWLLETETKIYSLSGFFSGRRRAATAVEQKPPDFAWTSRKKGPEATDFLHLAPGVKL